MKKLTTVCCACGALRDAEGGWSPAPAGWRPPAPEAVSHGLCNACGARELEEANALLEASRGRPGHPGAGRPGKIRLF